MISQMKQGTFRKEIFKQAETAQEEMLKRIKRFVEKQDQSQA
jgi:hypothetical protein